MLEVEVLEVEVLEVEVLEVEVEVLGGIVELVKIVEVEVVLGATIKVEEVVVVVPGGS